MVLEHQQVPAVAGELEINIVSSSYVACTNLPFVREVVWMYGGGVGATQTTEPNTVKRKPGTT
jgi:hypothetical protein